MGIVERLMPKDTEELKPGLFIQKTRKGYRQIEPLAWNGKMRWKPQIASVFSIRTFVTIAVVLFLAWAYVNDVGSLIVFYNAVHEDPIGYCNDVLESYRQKPCTSERQRQGICSLNTTGINFSEVKFNA